MEYFIVGGYFPNDQAEDKSFWKRLGKEAEKVSDAVKKLRQ